MKNIFGRNFDWHLFSIWIILAVFGIIAITTASAAKIGDEIHLKNYYWKQIIWLMISIIAFIIVLKIPLPILDMLIYPLYLATIILLIIVLFMPPVNNSRSWLFLGGVRFQPSELAKMMMILLVSKLIAKDYLNELKMLYKALSVVIIPVFLILLEPDFGTTIIFWEVSHLCSSKRDSLQVI